MAKKESATGAGVRPAPKSNCTWGAIRGISEGMAAESNWAANHLVSLTFLSLVQALGPSWTFWLYGLLAIGSFIFSWSLGPETKGRTLEEIEQTWRSRQS